MNLYKKKLVILLPQPDSAILIFLRIHLWSRENDKKSYSEYTHGPQPSNRVANFCFTLSLNCVVIMSTEVCRCNDIRLLICRYKVSQDHFLQQKPLKLHDNPMIQPWLNNRWPNSDFRDFTKSIDAKRGSAKKLYPSKFKLSSRGWEIKVNAPYQKTIISNFDFRKRIGKMKITLFINH